MDRWTAGRLGRLTNGRTDGWCTEDGLMMLERRMEDKWWIDRIVRILKGYGWMRDRRRAKMTAYNHGKQQNMQPPSYRSGERFKGRKTMYMAGVGHDSLVNEYDINVSKWLGLIKWGFHHHKNPIKFNCVWKFWAF